MEGVVELAESIFQTSVRLGIPSKFQGMETILQNPIYSTSIGLIEHGYKQLNHEMLFEQNQGFFTKLMRIVKSEYWLKNLIQLECTILGFYNCKNL